MINPFRGRSTKRLILLLFIAFGVSFFASGGSLASISAAWERLGSALPAPEKRPPAINTHEMAEPGIGERTSRLLFIRRAVNARMDRAGYVRLEDIPDDLQKAVIAVEDRKFYDHIGIDPAGIMRATLVNLQEGRIEEGASTITQQLVKNLFLTREQSFGRKGEEILLALDMEANYSKDEILELYLNTIYYGSNYYGIGDAAAGYFGKTPRALNLAESAMLAGLPQAPSIYSPYVDFKRAKRRQFVVLDAMVATGDISKTTAEDAKRAPIELAHAK